MLKLPGEIVETNLMSNVEMEGDGQQTPWLEGRVPNGYWNIRTNRGQYMKWLGKRLGFQQPDDWYGIKQHHFKENFGGGMLATIYRDSVYAAVVDHMPEQQWWPWLFSRTPQGFWKNPANRRSYMKWLEEKLEISTNDHWYRVTKKDFVNNGGAGLLHGYYESSVVPAIKEYKPRMNLMEWRFEVVPQGFWSSAENLRRYMNWLALQLDIRTPELWYSIDAEDIKRNHGSTPLNLKGGSVFRMVSDYLPDFDWKPWLFKTSVPAGFWKVEKNRHDYLRWLAAELGLEGPSDWYQLTHLDFKRTGGSGLFMAEYGNSLMRAARERYPEYAWNPKLFQHHSKQSAGDS